MHRRETGAAAMRERLPPWASRRIRWSVTYGRVVGMPDATRPDGSRALNRPVGRDVLNKLSLPHESLAEESALSLGVGADPVVSDGAAPGGFSPTQLLPYKWSILATFVVLAGLSAAGVMLMLRPAYTATAKIEVLPVIPQLMQGKSDLVPLYESFRASQVDHILGTEVLDAVLDRADVKSTAFYRGEGKSRMERLIERLGFRPSMSARDRLLESLTVEAPKGKEHIYVAMSAPTPGEPRLIVDAVVEVFTKLSNQQASDADLDRMSKIKENIRSKGGELSRIQSLAAQRRQRLKTSEPEQILQMRLMRLDHLKSQLAELERQSEVQRNTPVTQPDSSSGQSAVATDPSLRRRFAADPEWSALRSELLAAQASLTEAGRRYGESHRMMKQLRRDAESAEQRLAAREGVLLSEAPEGGSGGTEQAELEIAARIDALRKSIKSEEESYRADFDDQETLRELNAQSIKASETLVALQNELERIEMNRQVAGSIRPWKAYEPLAPSEDKRVKLLIAALVGSLFAAIGLAFVRIRLSPTLHDAELSLPRSAGAVLGWVPTIPKDPKERAMSVEMLGESVRLLRTTVLRAMADSRKRIVQVTSAAAGTGKTTLSLLMARSFAALGKRVLIVDTDFRRPKLSEQWGLRNHDGLLPYLKQRGRLAYVTPEQSAPTLFVLPAGACDDHEHPDELANGLFRDLITTWREQFDFVVLDGPPLLGSADAAMISGQVDATILVVREGFCRRAAIGAALGTLGQTGGRLLGTVVVGSSRGQYSYYYRNAYRWKHSDRASGSVAPVVVTAVLDRPPFENG